MAPEQVEAHAPARERAAAARVQAAVGRHRPIESTTGVTAISPAAISAKPLAPVSSQFEARLERARDLAEQVVEEDHRDGSRGDQPGDAEEALAAG